MFEIDPKHVDLRTERRTWSAVSLLSFSLLVAAIYRISWLALYYSGRLPNIGAFVGLDRLDFWLRTLATWSKLLAAVGLLSISSDGGWRRRGIFYVICAFIDVGLWSVDSTEEVGVLDDQDPIVAWFKAQEWLRYGIGTAVGWSEFVIVTGMLADIGVAHGTARAQELEGSIRKLTTTGMAIWMLFYLSATRWGGPNPIGLKRLTVETFLLWQVVRLLWTIVLIRITAQSVLVLQAIGQLITTEMRRQRKSEEWPLD